MAKMPGWIEVMPPRKGELSADGKSVVYTFRVRKWHPGFWWALLRRGFHRTVR
jgi:hypothetical protein